MAWAVVAESGWTPREAWAVPSDFTVVLTPAPWAVVVEPWAYTAEAVCLDKVVVLIGGPLVEDLHQAVGG